jgi:hypothetical protein
VHFNLVEVSRDGSCMIHSALFFIDGPHQATSHRVMEIRKMIADHFGKNKEEYRTMLEWESLDAFNRIDVPAYIKKSAEDPTFFLGEAAVKAISELFKVNVLVNNRNGAISTEFKRENPEKELRFFFDRLHYRPIRSSHEHVEPPPENVEPPKLPIKSRKFFIA